MRILGDIHGDTYTYEFAIKDVASSIQVGDFGIGFAGPYWHDKVNEMHEGTNHRFIRGNHDNPEKCKDMVGYIDDGTIEDDWMFVGGAWSIDRPMRTEGVNWWEDEELSYDELYRMIDLYEESKPRVMITHDCPTTTATEMFFKSGKLTGVNYGSRTADAFQSMFEIHQPKFWFFGHWHFTEQMNINGTTFQCVGSNDYVNFDGNVIVFS